MKAVDLLKALAGMVPYISTVGEAIDLIKGIIDRFGEDVEVTDSLIQAERAKLLPKPE